MTECVCVCAPPHITSRHITSHHITSHHRYILLCGHAPFTGDCGYDCGWKQGKPCALCAVSYTHLPSLIRIQFHRLLHPYRFVLVLQSALHTLTTHRSSSLRTSRMDTLSSAPRCAVMLCCLIGLVSLCRHLIRTQEWDHITPEAQDLISRMLVKSDQACIHTCTSLLFPSPPLSDIYLASAD